VDSRLHQPRLVRHRPIIEGLPEVGDDGFVDMPTKGIDLVYISMSIAGKTRRPTFSSVTFQSLIFVFGGSFDHET
jgi:hypothetical protein